MAQGTAALAQKLVAKKSNNGTKKSAPKKSTTTKKSNGKKQSVKPASGTINPRVDRPWSKIKSMYEAGKSKEEMSKTLKIKFTSMNGIMDRLVRGIVVDGKTIRITRGKK